MGCVLCAWKAKCDKHLSAETSQHITKRAAIGDKHGFQPPVTVCSFEYAQSKHLVVERRLKRSSTFTTAGERWNKQGHKDIALYEHTHTHSPKQITLMERNFCFLPFQAVTAAVESFKQQQIWVCGRVFVNMTQLCNTSQERRKGSRLTVSIWYLGWGNIPETLSIAGWVVCWQGNKRLLNLAGLPALWGNSRPLTMTKQLLFRWCLRDFDDSQGYHSNNSTLSRMWHPL